MIKTIVTSLLLIFTLSISAQQSKKAPCDTDKHKEFDFWSGNWDVYNAKNKLIGSNRILKMHSGCVMQENWESKVGPSRGTSYNYVDLKNNTWNQVWVDNAGFSLLLKGNLIDGKMVLKSDLVKGIQGDYYNRVTWTPNNDGSVTQVWDYLNKKGKVIQEAFRGIYKKKN